MRDYPTQSSENAKPRGSTAGLLSKHGGLKVAVVTPLDEAGEFLLRELQRLRLMAHHVPPSEAPLLANFDVVYCDYDPQLPLRISWPAGDGRVSLIVILPQTGAISLDTLTAMMPQAVLARPFTRNAILASVIVARLHSTTEERLRTKAEHLEETLRSARTIERAKSMLMSARGIDADEAYRYMRSLAMTRRVSVSTLAAAILSSLEVLGGG